jgi:hypothetical protein
MVPGPYGLPVFHHMKYIIPFLLFPSLQIFFGIQRKDVGKTAFPALQALAVVVIRHFLDMLAENR